MRRGREAREEGKKKKEILLFQFLFPLLSCVTRPKTCQRASNEACVGFL